MNRVIEDARENATCSAECSLSRYIDQLNCVVFWTLRNMQNVPQCAALLQCTGNVPQKFVPVHIPVPVRASLTTE